LRDRKYRHQGYQDSGQPSGPKGPRTPRPDPPPQRIEGAPRGRSAGAPGPAVFTCSVCSGVQRTDDELPEAAVCSCGADLHTCRNCKSFDSTTHWECRDERLPARVTPKDSRNSCPWFSPRIIRDLVGDKSAPKVEQMSDARRAFEDLFKK
jgi:hypothetical protein